MTQQFVLLQIMFRFPVAADYYVILARISEKIRRFRQQHCGARIYNILIQLTTPSCCSTNWNRDHEEECILRIADPPRMRQQLRYRNYFSMISYEICASL